MSRELIWLLTKYGGLCIFLGFICGTAIAHIFMYAKYFRGRKSPLKGFSAFGILLVLGLALVVSRLHDNLSIAFGELRAALIGLGFQFVGAVIGFIIRWRAGLGPPPNL